VSSAEAIIVRRASAGYVRVIGAARVAICSGPSTEVVEWNDIILARSAKNYTWIVTRQGAIRVRRPLQVVIDTLATLGLVQIHRRVAVNDSKVRRLVRSGRRRLEILLDDELRLEVGRQYQRVIRARFGAEQRNRLPNEPMVSPVISSTT
jgi:DNA-binding LytR/AlgR family response regulator